MSAPAQHPSRVVDATHNGWWLMGTSGGAPGYANVDLYRAGQTLSPEELTAEHGPLRPVQPVTAADRAELGRLLTLAGRKGIYSLAAAVYRTLNRLRDDAGGFDLHQPDLNHRTHEISVRQLRAGRPGSWEAQQLTDLALWVGHGTPSRIHEEACAGMADMLYRWCADPARFTETAETLAAVVSEFADGHGGWPAVADRPVAPARRARSGGREPHLRAVLQPGRQFGPGDAGMTGAQLDLALRREGR